MLRYVSSMKKDLCMEKCLEKIDRDKDNPTKLPGRKLARSGSRVSGRVNTSAVSLTERSRKMRTASRIPILSDGWEVNPSHCATGQNCPSDSADSAEQRISRS